LRSFDGFDRGIGMIDAHLATNWHNLKSLQIDYRTKHEVLSKMIGLPWKTRIPSDISLSNSDRVPGRYPVRSKIFIRNYRWQRTKSYHVPQWLMCESSWLIVGRRPRNLLWSDLVPWTYIRFRRCISCDVQDISSLCCAANISNSIKAWSWLRLLGFRGNGAKISGNDLRHCWSAIILSSPITEDHQRDKAQMELNWDLADNMHSRKCPIYMIRIILWNPE
jgi:hypothetical protein